jgi:hypothetical protein
MTVENGGRMGVRFKGLRFISKILKVAIANYDSLFIPVGLPLNL